MRYLLFLLVFALSCSPKPTKYPKIEIQPEEYEVYNAFFSSIFDSIPNSGEFKHYQIFIVDSIGGDRDTLRLEERISAHKFKFINNQTLSDIYTDMFLKEAHVVHLEDRFTTKALNSFITFIIIKPSYKSYMTQTTLKKATYAPIYLTRLVFNDIYPEAPGIFFLSRVGFNTAKTEALLRCYLLFGAITPNGGNIMFKIKDGLWTTSDSSSNAMIHHIRGRISGKTMRSKS